MQDREAPNSEPVRAFLRSDLVALGEFHCSPLHPDFRHAGAMRRHCFVFPRRAVWIQHEHQPRFVGDPSRVALYNPGQAYERAALDPDGDHSDWVTVSENLAREVLVLRDPTVANAEPSRLVPWTHTGVKAHTFLQHRLLHQYVRENPNPDVMMVEETVVGLFAEVCEQAFDQHGPDPVAKRSRRTHRDLVEHVHEYLNRTYAENQGLTAIADAVGTSVFHMCRVFRRTTGLTIHAYRSQLRLRHALEALEDGDADLLTVALTVGYSGHSHFTAAFRRHFCFAPSALRDILARAGALAAPPPNVLAHSSVRIGIMSKNVLAGGFQALQGSS